MTEITVRKGGYFMNMNIIEAYKRGDRAGLPFEGKQMWLRVRGAPLMEAHHGMSAHHLPHPPHHNVVLCAAKPAFRYGQVTR